MSDNFPFQIRIEEILKELLLREHLLAEVVELAKTDGCYSGSPDEAELDRLRQAIKKTKELRGILP